MPLTLVKGVLQSGPMATKPKLVAYLRVSTQKQGDSGLGLEAQQATISHYAAVCGGEVVATFTEVESGRKSDRAQLAKALSHAKRIKGRLVIAKLDRLGRDVAFVSALMKSGVNFVACDNPHANKLTIHILAAVAEDEAERISARTRAALAAAKARGTLLGSARPGHWEGREQQRLAGGRLGAQRARAKRLAESEATYAAVRPTVCAMRESGASLQAIADRLNACDHNSPRGSAWTRIQVSRVLNREKP
jgi:DNA invertase Pin-like site-specific DNA recombinase